MNIMSQPTIDLKSSPVSIAKPTRIRWWLAFVFFLIGLIAYMDRSNISVVAEAMMQDFHMDKVEFGWLNSLFSLGYALAQIPAGLLAEQFGARWIVTIALFWWSIFTCLTAAVSSYGWLAVIRTFFGVGEGPMYPGNAVFNSYWFTKQEKGRAASALLAGSYFGPVIAPVLTVAIFQAWGWRSVFIVFGAIGLLIGMIWFCIGRDRPEQHPWVNKAELSIITEQRAVHDENKAVAPWGKFLKNVRFWALGLQYFVVIYIVTFFLVWLPTYLQEARHFSLTKMGFAASFPWIAILLTVLAGGALSDRLLRNGKSKLIARGGLAIFGLIVFTVSMYLAVYATNPWLNVLWLTLSLGSLGLPVVTSWAVANDLGNEYSGSVSGWMNLWGNIGAFLSPIFCGWLAQNFGWDATMLFNIVPILLAILLWFAIRPDRPLLNLK
jgi:ACS family glucarate transporter-like MFS transporter